MGGKMKPCKTQTPWGRADFVENVTRGINRYSTPSHGGYKVSAKLNASMPEAMRNDSGWYEEDIEWALVALAFPQHFSHSLEDAAAAEKTVKDWYPYRWEAWTGRELQPGESMTKDRDRWYAEHANDYIVISALGMDDGTVKVWATVGGKRDPENTVRCFLVPHDEYGARRGAFLVDLDRHREVPENYDVRKR